MADKRDFVLVHGAWLGGWVWQEVAAELERCGHRVFRPTLTGLCDRAHLLNDGITLTTHVEDIARLIEWEGLENFVLVGHSYGGLVISRVAERVPRGTIGSIVFLEALMPPFPRDDAMLPEVEVVDGAALPVSIEMFGYPPDLAARLEAGRTPMPIGALTMPVPKCMMVELVPIKTYVWARNSAIKANNVFFQRCVVDPSWRTEIIDEKHDVMLTNPQLTAEILVRAACFREAEV